MACFIVVAPPYSRSGGVRVLHRLSGELVKLGYDTRLAILDSAGIREAKAGELSTRSATSLREADEASITDSIVIYPEIVTQNILGASKVVWYLLNGDGALGRGKIQAGPRDYFLAHSSGFGDPRAKRVLSGVEFAPYFRDGMLWKDRRLDLTYVGKGRLYGECTRVADTVEITNEWPRSQEELALLLRSTRFLFTWDSVTALMPEAALCGAIPVVMRWPPWTPEALARDEIGPPVLEFAKYGRRDEISRWFEARREFERRLQRLNFTWSERVRAFAEEAIGHFRG